MLTRSNQMFGGITPFSSTRMVLIKEAIPLAPSKWPMFDFTAPMINGSRWDLYVPKDALMALASIGSPSAVPVPIIPYY